MGGGWGGVGNVLPANRSHPFRSDDSLPRSDRNMYGTFLQGKLERYGGAVVFVRTRQTCPSVSVGDIIQDRKQRRSQPRRKWPVGQLDSWRSSNVLVKFSSSLHHRRPSLCSIGFVCVYVY